MQVAVQSVLDLVARETNTPLSRLSYATKLDDLGMDSLDYVELLQCIGREIGPVRVKDYDTIGDIAAAIEC
jgi:acyl carrier protein